MRKDMAKVVTEAPRRGHANPSSKWGRRLTKDEYDLDDHGASRAPISPPPAVRLEREGIFRRARTAPSVSAQAGRAPLE